MTKQTPHYEPILAHNERDMRKNIREISTRLNNNPDLARMVFVNPILAFEDVGVQFSPEVKKHIMDRIRFPPKLKEKIARLEKELKEELAELKFEGEFPLSPEGRARLLFNVLNVKPLEEEKGDGAPEASAQAQPAIRRLESNRTKHYKRQHPLIAKLAEYERSRQGSLIFHPRDAYDEYKSGKRKHRWIKAVRFKV